MQLLFSFNRGAPEELRKLSCKLSSLALSPDTPDAIRQRDAIFRFSLTDNFDSSLNFPNI
jgi:hypothetical protein